MTRFSGDYLRVWDFRTSERTLPYSSIQYRFFTVLVQRRELRGWHALFCNAMIYRQKRECHSPRHQKPFRGNCYRNRPQQLSRNARDESAVQVPSLTASAQAAAAFVKSVPDRIAAGCKLSCRRRFRSNDTCIIVGQHIVIQDYERFRSGPPLAQMEPYV
jgi:hypothetical protein